MTRYLIGISLLFLLACHSHETHPDLERAFAVHQQALQTHDSLKQELNVLQAQSLTSEEEKAWDRLQEASIQWEEGIFEVPGFDHEHSHGHHHHHDHAHDALKDLPPLEVLNIQEAMLQEAKLLLDKTRQLSASIVQPSS